MLSLERRIELLVALGNYIAANDESWQEAKDVANRLNPWFTPEHIEMAAGNIVAEFLQKEKLEQWAGQYKMPATPKTVGIVMAGNIPLVGFHDFLCGFVAGHKLVLKLSSKDEALLRHLLNKLIEWEPAVAEQVTIADLLKGCDAYIATGSNNTARYFEQYFGKYPHIIRKNRTSAAILDGTETEEQLNLLSDDVFTYFGLGCRNVTQVWLPKGYDIERLLKVFSRYDDIMVHHKYKHNYDYYLAIYLLNKVPYLTNGSLLMVENEQPFSAVSVLHYGYYDDKQAKAAELLQSTDIQCVVSKEQVPFGAAQKPSLNDFADGVDTMEWLVTL